VSGEDVSTVGCLLDGVGGIAACAAIGLLPGYAAIGIQFQYPRIKAASAGG